MIKPVELTEHVHVSVSLFSNGVVHCVWAYRDADPANDLKGTRRFVADTPLDDAVDEMGRVLCAWAAVGRLALARFAS